jgi:hypothetical protein
MIIAGVGGRKVVSGMRIAMAEEGPIPGKTPTNETAYQCPEQIARP